jgi:hypothetical protein
LLQVTNGFSFGGKDNEVMNITTASCNGGKYENGAAAMSLQEVGKFSFLVFKVK